MATEAVSFRQRDGAITGARPMISRRRFLKTPAPWPLASGARAATAPCPTKAIPLLLSNWADPTVLKDGPDYYMTHSSFVRQPGLLIWQSRDLRQWKPLGHAVVNQEGTIWAPGST